MTTLTLESVNLDRWLAANLPRFKPPVSNAIIWPNSDLMIQMITGPNSRTDFHDDPYAELFIQLKGDISLLILEGGKLHDVRIKEGDIYVCPAHVRHSPQRGADTFGLVIEVQRKGEEIDAFEWYCPECVHLLHRVEIKLRDPEADARRAGMLFNEFYQDLPRRTCSQCGAVHPRP